MAIVRLITHYGTNGKANDEFRGGTRIATVRLDADRVQGMIQYLNSAYETVNIEARAADETETVWCLYATDYKRPRNLAGFKVQRLRDISEALQAGMVI